MSACAAAGEAPVSFLESVSEHVVLNIEAFAVEVLMPSPSKHLGVCVWLSCRGVAALEILTRGRCEALRAAGSRFCVLTLWGPGKLSSPLHFGLPA